MVNFIMARVPLAVGIWAVPWYDRPSRVAAPATMTDVAVDASTPVGPAAVLDLDWLAEAGPASVPGCEELPGLDPGVAPVPSPAGADREAAGAGSGLGAGRGRHRTHRMQFSPGGVVSCPAVWPARVVLASSSGRTA